MRRSMLPRVSPSPTPAIDRSRTIARVIVTAEEPPAAMKDASRATATSLGVFPRTRTRESWQLTTRGGRLLVRLSQPNRRSGDHVGSLKGNKASLPLGSRRLRLEKEQDP